MKALIIKNEYKPIRCEICHQSDLFDADRNHCQRCVSVQQVAFKLNSQIRHSRNNTNYRQNNYRQPLILSKIFNFGSYFHYLIIIGSGMFILLALSVVISEKFFEIVLFCELTLFFFTGFIVGITVFFTIIYMMIRDTYLFALRMLTTISSKLSHLIATLTKKDVERS